MRGVIVVVIAMTGQPKVLIPAPGGVQAHLAVLPGGQLEPVPPSLLQEGFTRGQVAADETFKEKNLVLEREVAEVVPTYQRVQPEFERNAPLSADEYAKQGFENLKDDADMIKAEVEKIAQTSQNNEMMVGKLEGAETKARLVGMDTKSNLLALVDQTADIRGALGELNDNTQSAGATTHVLNAESQDEKRKTADLEGRMNIMDEKMTGAQGTIRHKLNILSEGTEKLHGSALMLTQRLNLNSDFITQAVATLTIVDDKAVNEIDETVALMRKMQEVDQAAAAEAAAKKKQETDGAL